MGTSQEVPLNPETPSGNYVDLPSGKPLDSEEASGIIRRTGAPVVLLVGAVESGKTTLLASLHETFQYSRFADYLATGYLAAGSDTLVGFEERCFDSRATSGAVVPLTLRTTFDEGLLFYHLKVRNQSLETPTRHLLLADMSGEFYERAMDSALETRDLTIIRRADHFVYLVDAANLASKELKNLTRTNTLLLMRRCFEQNMLKQDARIEVLLTKWDIVLLQRSQEEAEQLLDEYRRLFTKEWGPRVGRINVAPIAARPHYKSALPIAYGLADILRRWLEEPPAQLKPVGRRIPVPSLARTFDTFAMKEAAELFEVKTNG